MSLKNLSAYVCFNLFCVLDARSAHKSFFIELDMNPVFIVKDVSNNHINSIFI